MLASSNASDRHDYWLGASLFSMVIFSIFMVWTVIMVIWKCMGHKRVGFLAGGPFNPQAMMDADAAGEFKQVNDKKDNIDNNKRKGCCARCQMKCCRRICAPAKLRKPVDARRVRCVFISSCVLLIIFLITSVMMGLESIPKAYRALEEVQKVRMLDIFILFGVNMCVCQLP
jgi:hypothetical protein